MVLPEGSASSQEGGHRGGDENSVEDRSFRKLERGRDGAALAHSGEISMGPWGRGGGKGGWIVTTAVLNSWVRYSSA